MTESKLEDKIARTHPDLHLNQATISKNAFILRTFCMIDEEETCVSVSVYNQADGKGVVIADSVAIPDPFVQNVSVSCDDKKLEFTNIRLSSPVTLTVNGRLISELHTPTTVSVSCNC